MQFKHPELLWALLLLLVPIFIHLFQLRRFKKTPFTNVAMLQMVISESRKSNRIKKWLLLFNRLGLLAALVVAFAQPFFAEKTALKAKETVIYLDNSYSMQAKKEGLALLESAVQELAKTMDTDETFSLFTNDRTYRNVRFETVQNELLTVSYSNDQLDLETIRLKASTLFSKNAETDKRLHVISDFQNRVWQTSSNDFKETYVQLVPESRDNTALDSLMISEGINNQKELTVMLSTNRTQENTPIAIYNEGTLIAKTAAEFNDKGKAQVVFSLPPGDAIKGRASIEDGGLAYDNQLFFNLDPVSPINVLAVTEGNANYLRRIFTDNEFNLTTLPLNRLDYSQIERQNLVVLDGLKTIPNNLQRVLKNFYDNGGSIVIVPSAEANIASYNGLLSNFSRTQFTKTTAQNQKISQISFENPLYRGVFEKRVSNFQSPEVRSYLNVRSQLSQVLTYENGDAFLVAGDRCYIFTADLAIENSNFQNSPLIVPTFYNIGILSLQNPKPYFIMGAASKVDVAASLGPDNILQLSKPNVQFIPRQQVFDRKTTLFMEQEIPEAGTYAITDKDSVYAHVSFNHPRNESQLQYAQVPNAEASITNVFDALKAANEVTGYWKWFVILTLLFLLMEILIQKFMA